MVIEAKNVLVVTDEMKEFGVRTASTLREAGLMLGVSHQAVSKALLKGSPIGGRWRVRKVSRIYAIKDMGGMYRVCVKNKVGEYVDLNPGWKGREVEQSKEITNSMWA